MVTQSKIQVTEPTGVFNARKALLRQMYTSPGEELAPAYLLPMLWRPPDVRLTNPYSIVTHGSEQKCDSNTFYQVLSKTLMNYHFGLH